MPASRAACRTAGGAPRRAACRAAGRIPRRAAGRAVHADRRIGTRTPHLLQKAGAAVVAPGATVAYRLIVKATGGTAHDVVVCDRLPAHMTYVSLGSATLANGEACWTVGDLRDSRTLTFTARVDLGTPAGKLVNVAVATSSKRARRGTRPHPGAGAPCRQGRREVPGVRSAVTG